MTIVDLKPLVDLVLQDVVAPIVLAMISWLSFRLLQLIGINKDSALGARLLTAASNGAAFALAKANTALDQNTTIEVKSQIVADAVKYVGQATPDAIKALGLDTIAGQAHLENVVLGQLQKLSPPVAVAVPAAAPVQGTAE